jgi:class 3 adenylate cyclase
MPPQATEPHRRSALDEARERESAMLAILRVINQSRMDYQPVFDVILEYATKFCHAPFANLNLINEDRTHLDFVAHWGTPLKSFRPGWQWPIDSPMVIARAVREKRTIHVHDLADDVLYRQGDPLRVKIVDEEGVRTFVAVPLISGDQAIGSIGLFRREVAPFSSDQIELVQTFAEQAVIAVENTRQFRELAATNAELNDTLEQQTATSEILQLIASSRAEAEPVLKAVSETACRICDAYDAVITLRDGDWLRLAAHFGPIPFDVEGIPLNGTHSTSRAVLEGKPIHVEDILAVVDEYPDAARLAERTGWRTVLAVPLMRNGLAIGAIGMRRIDPKGFTQKQIQLSQTFAAQAVIAIENVRQFKALESLNAELADRVQEQVVEIERMGRLKRFLPVAVADTVISSGSEKILESHRALLGVLFCDIRGFTAFCETAEPEETIEVLQTYHEEMGKLINAHGAGVDHRMGDGIMVLFNDPLPCEDPAGDAVRLAIALRERMVELCKGWKKLGHRLGFGVGISLGYATVGMVGYEGRYDYTASGTSVNLAARLCELAEDGEILLSPRAYTAIEDDFKATSEGEVSLKGIREPVEIYKLMDA